MTSKITVGPVNKGLRNDRTAFVIDNDSFPTLINAYQWRGRVKRKRGTSTLGRLTRFFDSTSTSYSSFSTFNLVFGGGGASGNLFTGFNLQANGNIVPGTVSILDNNTGVTYTDPGLDGVLVGGSPGSNINYATGNVFLVILGGHAISANFSYYPDLPVMGLEDLELTATQFPGTIAFDTTYAYSISTSTPYTITDVSFYKNPSGGYPGYTAKASKTPTTWNGQDYQQFWTTNYQGAFWATNGIKVPFDPATVTMQYAPSLDITFIGVTATTLSVTIANCPLVIGDFVFVNEWTGANASSLNLQSGYVTACVPNTTPSALKTITITFPNANIGAGPYNPGIIQYLTNRSDTTKDCLRWYDGDPNTTDKGWVNFAPPLNQFTLFPNFSVGGQPPNQYYLIGARMIVPFKDRLLFLGPVIQTSAVGSAVYLQDTIIYSQNGTVFYTASFSGSPTSAATVFNPILVPTNQTATASAYFEDSTGFGGFTTAGLSQEMLTVSSNEDVLIIGFDNNFQTRLVYSGSNLNPFNFYLINSELGSASTFSAINTDIGVITRGARGFIITSQVEAKRIDLEIPDEVFEINLKVNGNERFCAQRDYIAEWIYFTYPSNSSTYLYPNQTLQYNYRDNSWAIFYETYTTYGQFRKLTGQTWLTIPANITWQTWNTPWNAGSNTLLQPDVIAGNQQGFVMVRDNSTTEEGASLYIQSFSGSVVTSPNHNLINGDYIIITGCIGTISAQVNNKVFSVANASTNTFQLNPTIGSGTYIGGGLITKLYVPYIQTKQFPVAWADGRKIRIGTQRYLLTTTDKAQIQLLIFLSQDDESPFNLSDISSYNNALIYSTVLYTCPESINLGLTPANVNLMIPTSATQQQTWHRINTSLVGDTVQIGFTISDSQMRTYTSTGDSFAITGATQANPCVLNCVGMFAPGQLIQITDVVGMTQLNYTNSANNVYNVISSTGTQVTIDVDSTSFGAYSSGGTAVSVATINQTDEIEIHGFILDVSPSQMLV